MKGNADSHVSLTRSNLGLSQANEALFIIVFYYRKNINIPSRNINITKVGVCINIRRFHEHIFSLKGICAIPEVKKQHASLQEESAVIRI